MKKEITYEDYSKIEILAGTVLKVSKNEKARKPSLVIEVDFGPDRGVKKSSAQITDYYDEKKISRETSNRRLQLSYKKYCWRCF